MSFRSSQITPEMFDFNIERHMECTSAQAKDPANVYADIAIGGVVTVHPDCSKIFSKRCRKASNTKNEMTNLPLPIPQH